MQTLSRRMLISLLISCLGSIGLLLAHVSGLSTMHALLWPVALPSLLWIVAAWIISLRRQNTLIAERLHLGLVGGLWGTVGYDVVRVPLHLMGLNPFPPIRAYGMWVSAMDHATPWTDLAGFAYHISNGITFGWIYALLMTGRHWSWGVLWGLGLEALAIVSPFGDLFGLRAFSQTVIVAFVAHLFYGYPLGRICQANEGGRLAWPIGSVIALGAWFVLAWQPVAGYPDLHGRVIRFGPVAIYPGMRDILLQDGSAVMLSNETDRAILVRMRGARDWHQASGVGITLPPKSRMRQALPSQGLFQFAVPGEPWRSAWVFAWNRRVVNEAGALAPTPPH